MRKSDIRKWLHAVLDLLPVVLIPVFMIYSHRHDVTENTTVDIQYKFQTNEVNSLDDIVIGNIYHCDNLLLSSFLNNESDFKINVVNWEEIYLDDINLDDARINNYNSNLLNMVVIYHYDDGEGNFEYDFTIGNENGYSTLTTYNIDSYILNGDFYVSLGLDTFKEYITNILNADDSLILNDLVSESSFNVIDSVDVYDEHSNIMYVFLDDFNNSIDKYFNMGNVFNLNGVYDWFVANIFNGSAPAVMYSVWQIVLYEFVMDLLFLLYALFMFFIDACEHLIEGCYSRAKGGRK